MSVRLENYDIPAWFDAAFPHILLRFYYVVVVSRSLSHFQLYFLQFEFIRSVVPWFALNVRFLSSVPMHLLQNFNI